MNKGMNVYDEVHFSFGTLNESKEMEKWAASKKQCVFLSHRRVDKAAVVAIAHYIRDSGVNIYLDANDQHLQAADRAGDDATVANCIERGISFSTDVLALISEKTQRSWWVPYELGYGKMAGKILACLKLKDVAKLPSFLSIVKQILNRQELKGYVQDIKRRESCVEVTTAAHGGKVAKVNLLAGRLVDLLLESQGIPAELGNYID
jgi:hypothetical protein